jgi:hypothetical protein
MDDNCVNLAADGIFSRRTHYNSLCRDKNKHYGTSYMTVYKGMSHVILPCMHKLAPNMRLVA